MRFQGRVAVITGGGSGLGRVLARRFAAEGASVIVADVVGHSATAVADEISEAGGRSLAHTTDVTDATDVEAMVETAREAFGPVDDLHGLRLSVPYLAGVGLQPSGSMSRFRRQDTTTSFSSLSCGSGSATMIDSRRRGSTTRTLSVPYLAGVGLQPGLVRLCSGYYPPLVRRFSRFRSAISRG